MKDVIITDNVTGNAQPATVIVTKEEAKKAPVTSIFESGWKAIAMPTPQLATKIFRVILYAAALVSIIVPMFPEIPHQTAEIVNSWAIRLVALSHAISKMFGIDISAVVPPNTQTDNGTSTITYKK